MAAKRRSGENATAFARRHGLRAGRLVYWSKRFATSASVSAATVSFVPAAVVAAAVVATAVVATDEVAAVIRGPGGIAIELASATPMQISAVASALARPAP